jgi:hypothetical protein
VPTLRSLLDDIRNALDYLFEADVVLYVNTHGVRHERLTWFPPGDAPVFELGGLHSTVELYRDWTSAGHYSAVLPDASLLQLTYDGSGNEIAGHRLVYVPCPVSPDEDLLQEGEAILDVVNLEFDEKEASRLLLRSPVRFDYDPGAAAPGHSASHLAINSAECRIPCVAPVHPYKFLDFVFRHFYPETWHTHEDFFAAGADRRLGSPTIEEEERDGLHLTWRAR